MKDSFDTTQLLDQFPDSQQSPDLQRRIKKHRLLDKRLAVMALRQALVMLRPDIQWKNPVMFVVEVGALLTLFYIMDAAWGDKPSQEPLGYFIALDVWLFLTVLFANFATALSRSSRESSGRIASAGPTRYTCLSPEQRQERSMSFPLQC